MSNSGEGRFFESLGANVPTYIPGGIVTDGPIVGVESDAIQDFFKSTPLCGSKLGAGAATGTTGDENLCNTGMNIWEYHVLGTQTIDGPTEGTYGMHVVQDAVENDGAEYSLGIRSYNPAVFIVGTSPAFYAKMQFYCLDVSDADECAFGFRKMEAYQATLDGYDAMAVLNNISGDINIETITDNASNVTTDTTLNWANTEIHEFEVRVSAAGVVTYKVDGITPPTVAAFTFTDAEIVIPFFYYLLDATPTAAAIELINFECGLQ